MSFLSREEENKIEARLSDVAFEKLGVRPPGPVVVTYRANAVDFELGEIRLNPAMMGAAALIFKSLWVKVGVGVADRDKNLLYFSFRYHYVHPDGGRNGHNARFEEDFNYGV